MPQATFTDFSAADLEDGLMIRYDAFEPGMSRGAGGGGGGAHGARGSKYPDMPLAAEEYLVDPTLQLVYLAMDTEPLKHILRRQANKIFRDWKPKVVYIDPDATPNDNYLKTAKSLVARTLDKMVTLEHRNKVSEALNDGWLNVLASKYGPCEYTLEKNKELGTYWPGALRVLPFHSFSKEAMGSTGNEWQVDSLCPGIRFNQIEERYEFWQTKDDTDSEPTLVNPKGSGATQGIALMKDTILGNQSFVSTILPLFFGYLVAARRLDQAVFRNGGVTAFGKVDSDELIRLGTSGTAISKEANMAYVTGQLVPDLVKTMRGLGTATSAVLLPGGKIEFPPISFPMDPMEAEKFFRMRILNTLIPRDIVETEGNSLTSTGPSILSLDAEVAEDWRPIVGPPIEWVLTHTILHANGFDDLKFVFDWRKLTPEDKPLRYQYALEAADAGYIPPSRLLKYLDMDQLSDVEKKELKDRSAKKAAVGEGI